MKSSCSKKKTWTFEEIRKTRFCKRRPHYSFEIICCFKIEEAGVFDKWQVLSRSIISKSDGDILQKIPSLGWTDFWSSRWPKPQQLQRNQLRSAGIFGQWTVLLDQNYPQAQKSTERFPKIMETSHWQNSSWQSETMCHCSFKIFQRQPFIFRTWKL